MRYSKPSGESRKTCSVIVKEHSSAWHMGRGVLLQRHSLLRAYPTDFTASIDHVVVSAAFAAGNFLGPCADRPDIRTRSDGAMIAFTYIIRGAAGGHAISVRATDHSEMRRGAGWRYSFASAAASSAYLTVSETFRGKSAPWTSSSSCLGTASGGIVGAGLSAWLESGSRTRVFRRLYARRGADDRRRVW